MCWTIALCIAVLIVIIWICRCVCSGESMVNNTRMIAFHYTEWCGYCKAMKPIWEQVKIATANSGIIYREIDEDRAKTPGITGYPTIVMVDERGKRSVYPGPPDFNQLRNWIVSRH